MPAAIIGGVIAAGGAVASAAIGSHAASSAANAAQNAANSNNALQEQIYNSNKGLEMPFISAGDTAESDLMAFLGLGGDPAATDAAFQKYLNSTGYKFAYDQGINAVGSSKAAQGLLGSGSLVTALDQYGTGLAQQYGQQYVDNLYRQEALGANSANALAGQGAGYANAVSANNNSAASASGNASLASAGLTSNAIGQAINAFATMRGQSSYGGGGAPMTPAQYSDVPF